MRVEVDCLSLVSHPNILQWIAAYEDPVVGELHLVTPLYSGGNLKDRLDKLGSLPEAEAAPLAQKLLGALAHCHGRGLAHRDVKPSHVLFEEHTGEPKLIDFGLARPLPPRPGFMTTLAGSLPYISPNVLARKYTEKADLWSLGVLLYQALLGELPLGLGRDGGAGAWPEGGGGAAAALVKIRCAPVEVTGGGGGQGLSAAAKGLLLALLRKQEGARPCAEEALRHPWVQGGPPFGGGGAAGGEGNSAAAAAAVAGPATKVEELLGAGSGQ